MTWYSPFRTGSVLDCSVDDFRVIDASVTSTRLRDDYRPMLVPGTTLEPMADGELRGIGSTAYVQAIADTWRHQRIAAYRDAIVKLPRTPWPIFWQLVTQTISNKVAAVGSRISGRAGR
jgi:hypothetical protein